MASGAAGTPALQAPPHFARFLQTFRRMKARVVMLWAAVRDSLWFVPAVMTLAITAAGWVLIHAELSGALRVSEANLLLSGGAEPARSLLAAIAGGLITVTGVAFSVTVVALQLSSTQFAPRVLPNFLADRANQIVLGTLIGTFTFNLLLLRVVDDPQPGGSPLPRVSIAFAMILAIASIVALIFFIHHAARSIQVSVILTRATKRALDELDGLFPENFGKEAELPPEEHTPHRAAVPAPASGYIQSLDCDRMFRNKHPGRIVIRMEERIGAFMLAGQPLATLQCENPPDESLTRQVQSAFILGPERTFEKDYELSLIEISDIAVKALSPGINDPTTAFHCIDRLSQLLLALATQHWPGPVRGDGGNTYVLVKDLPFHVAVDTAFSPILHFGASNPALRAHLLERIETLSMLISEKRRPPLDSMRAEILRRSAQDSESRITLEPELTPEN